MKKSIASLVCLVVFLMLPRVALAHCPLCTVGAGAAALLAVGLGVEMMTVGVFIGAFAWAFGLWLGRLLPHRVPRQTEIAGLISFFLTILPLLPLMQDYSSIYFSWFGPYGSLFNRTYLINRFVAGAVIGAVVVGLSPLISNRVTSLFRGKRFAYQGVILTFLLLIVASLIIEFVVL